MIRAKLFLSLPAIVSAFVLASCADSGVSGPIAPPSAVEHRSSGRGFIPPALSGSPLNVDGLELRAAWWDKNLKSQVRVSRKIDAAGGTISIPETGFTMFFPAGAVTAPITITVTADEKYVAYKMEPAGTARLTPSTARFSLKSLTRSTASTAYSPVQLCCDACRSTGIP